MYLIRKISPWQDQSRLYPIGNPAVGIFKSIEAAKFQKDEWEVQHLIQNGITNTYEYWDVDCTTELIKLNKFLHEEYNIKILTDERNKEYINVEDVIPTMFPESFANKDYLSVQKVMQRYYYKIEEINEVDKYVIIFNNDIIGWLNDEGVSSTMEFKFYSDELEARDEIKELVTQNFNKWSNNGTYNLVGPIKKTEFNQPTKLLLIKYPEIEYDDENHATGQQFKSQLRLDEIENGFNKLLEILESVDKNIFEIKQVR